MLPKECRAFLLGLTELTKRHRIGIQGCGCCGSPALVTIETSKESGYRIGDECDQLTWVDPSDSFTWREYKDEIIK